MSSRCVDTNDRRRGDFTGRLRRGRSVLPGLVGPLGLRTTVNHSPMKPFVPDILHNGEETHCLE